MAISFDGVPIIAAVAVAVPVVLGLLPAVPVPGAVLEVIAGIVIGPSVLGWVHIDAPIAVLSDLGLGMLLFLAGLEIDVDRLRGRLGRLAAVAFIGSAVLGVACAYTLNAAGRASRPLFLAIVLMSTSAGLLLPLLKDAGEEGTRFGQLVMTASALAEVVTIMLLSLLFSAASTTSADRLASLAIFLALVAVLGLALARVRRLTALERLLDRLEDRSAQLRVRATLTLALAFGGGAAVPGRAADRAWPARAAVRAPHRCPAGGRRRLDAGHHAHVCHRGHADRAHRRAHLADHQFALLAAGLLSAALFPGLALRLLAGRAPLPEPVRLEDTG